MTGFLEVTEKDTDMKILLPFSKILSISEDKDKNVFIETGVNAKGVSTGVYIKELYSQIRICLKGE